MTKWYANPDDLDPTFRKKVDAGFTKLNADGIVNACVPFGGGKRTDAMQIAMHAQGRKSLIEVNALRRNAKMSPIEDGDNKYAITDCDGVHSKSAHQSGKAVDIVPMDAKGNPYWPSLNDPQWRIIASAMMGQGLQWGGDWNMDGRTRSDGDINEKYIVDFPHYQERGV